VSETLEVMATYAKGPTCPKCGGGDVSVEYDPPGDERTYDRLLMHCKRCAYGWYMACRDAEPRGEVRAAAPVLLAVEIAEALRYRPSHVLPDADRLVAMAREAAADRARLDALEACGRANPWAADADGAGNVILHTDTRAYAHDKLPTARAALDALLLVAGPNTHHAEDAG
jgi:hypothetical protein